MTDGSPSLRHVIMLNFVKVGLTVEVGAAKELDVVCSALGGEAGVTHAGVTGLAEVPGLLGRTNILLFTGLTTPLSNFGLGFLQLKPLNLGHAHSVGPITFWSFYK